MSEAFRRKVLRLRRAKGNPDHPVRERRAQRRRHAASAARTSKPRKESSSSASPRRRRRVPRTIRKRFGEGEGTIPWIDYTTAMVNFYYFYCVDEDFGPFFLKFCSYFPYTRQALHQRARVSQAAVGQARHRLRSARQRFACVVRTRRGAAHRGGLRREEDRALFPQVARIAAASVSGRGPQGRLSLSTLGACRRSFPSLRSGIVRVHGREFFEEVIRENIDLGRPENGAVDLCAQDAQSHCHRRPMPDAHRHRGSHPFAARLLQEHAPQAVSQKLRRRGAALRTETTINNSYDFGVGRLLKNLPRLREIGFAANRRVLEVEKVSHDCRIGARGVRSTAKPGHGRWPARQRSALWRRARAGAPRRAPVAVPPARGLPQPATAAITCADARVGRKQHQVRDA